MENLESVTHAGEVRGISGEQYDLLCQKARVKVTAFLNKNSGLCSSSLFQELGKEFQRVATCTHRASANFDPDKFEERKIPNLGDDCLRILFDAAVLGQHHMALLYEQMSMLRNDDGESLTQVNGTSEDAARCQRLLQKEAGFFEIGKIVYHTRQACECDRRRDDAPPLSGLVQKLVCFVVSLFMFAPDVADFMTV